MSTFSISGKSLVVLNCLMLMATMFSLAGEAHALECYDCHGARSSQDLRPEDASYRNPSSGGFKGNHRTHMGNDAVKVTCAKCHPGSDSYTASHRDGMIKLASNINASPHADRATYKNSTSLFPQSADPVLNSATCTNVNCHFEKETPKWGIATTSDCNTCHSAPPQDGHHPGNAVNSKDKHGDYYGTTTSSCSYCHSDHAGPINFSHATSVGKRSLAVQFTKLGTSGGTYSGYSGNLTDVLPSQRPSDKRNGTCSDLYCHSDGLNPPSLTPSWSSTDATQCDSCHRYKGIGFLNMTSNAHGKLTSESWIRKYPCTYCHGATISAQTPIVGKPPVDGPSGGIIQSRYVNGQFSSSRHVNGRKDIKIDPFWGIAGERKTYSEPAYIQSTKVCDNVYCHSDGTTDPESVRAFPWDWRNANGTPRNAQCNDCHGHPRGENCAECHDGIKKIVIANISTVLSVQTAWKPGEEWKSAMPMFPNEGVNKPRANSHPRHMGTSFSCDECHFKTITTGGDCKLCHNGSIGGMGEASHLDAEYHVNRIRDVDFKRGGTYIRGSKTCSATACHTGEPPQWGASANNAIICITCHGTSLAPDIDDYGKSNNIKAQINLTEWFDTGHGRKSAEKGKYKSNNPAANFPGNPCWYCHDNKVMHNLSTVNPFRLKLHTQFVKRFENECVYCHMIGTTNAECLSCHNAKESLAPQLAAIASYSSAKWANRTTTVYRPTHQQYTSASPTATTCLVLGCHPSDVWTHNTGPNTMGTWTVIQKDDVKNQYMMMGVCLQCHDDDGNNKCAGCHGVKYYGSLSPMSRPFNVNSSNRYVYTDALSTPQTFTNISIPKKYKLGYNPGTGYIVPTNARASSVHFGNKHYQSFLNTSGWSINAKGKPKGTWKGGKFCWDCHDPHGDKNMYMIHDQVTTESDGIFGIPKPGKQKPVVFTQKVTGEDYAKSTGTINGICNVCHSTGSAHYRANGGDNHNNSYLCTKCHEHRFTDSHADKQSCNTCHKSKPVPRHSGFGLPVDCVKCHTGNVGLRVDIVGQFQGQSHHVQGTPINNKHCYECHWESTPEGLINNKYHEGYNFKNYSTRKDKKVDLVIYGPGVRPTVYLPYSSILGRATVTQFLAVNISSPDINTERKESANVTNHCLGCHSDQNNDTKPFNDCKTPRQYAWDLQSIAARYAQKGTTKWGKYSSATVNGKYKVIKALSAHGNATANQGGWNSSTGLDSNITNNRAGYANMSTVRRNVQCFDCHNSHGSKAGGITSSYVSYSGLRNGANLKEVTPNKGGYKVNYYAKPKADGTGVVNPFNAGSSQCFDCHMNAMKGDPGSNNAPWGYQSTFGAAGPIMGYKDTIRFGQGTKASTARFPERDSRKTILGGHLKGNEALTTTVADNQKIDGLCTPCHDPHGVSTTLGDNQAYAVPLLKGTWMTSPYKEDAPPPDPTGSTARTAPYEVGTPLFADNRNISWGDGSHHHNHPVDKPSTRHIIDHNTFGGSGRLSEDDTKFAGLCLRCHTKNAILGSYTGEVGSATGPNKAPWKSVPRIHAATKGWGANREHSFTCSKCHQPHNSALPRLMQSNCLDYKHRGAREAGGIPWAADRQYPRNLNEVGPHGTGDEHRGYPIGSLYGERYTSPEATTACHISRNTTTYESKNPVDTYPPVRNDDNGWPDGNYWNTKTPW